LLTGTSLVSVKFAFEALFDKIPRIGGSKVVPHSGIKKSRACGHIRTLVFGLH